MGCCCCTWSSRLPSFIAIICFQNKNHLDYIAFVSSHVLLQKSHLYIPALTVLYLEKKKNAAFRLRLVQKTPVLQKLFFKSDIPKDSCPLKTAVEAATAVVDTRGYCYTTFSFFCSGCHLLVCDTHAKRKTHRRREGRNAIRRD